MKFSEKFPDMNFIKEERDLMIRSEEFKPCRVCNEPTQYIDICFEAYYCSEECLDLEETKYWQCVSEPVESEG